MTPYLRQLAVGVNKIAQALNPDGTTKQDGKAARLAATEVVEQINKSHDTHCDVPAGKVLGRADAAGMLNQANAFLAQGDIVKARACICLCFDAERSALLDAASSLGIDAPLDASADELNELITAAGGVEDIDTDSTVDLASMKKAELLQLAEQMGLEDVTEKMTKAEITAAIEASADEHDDDPNE